MPWGHRSLDWDWRRKDSVGSHMLAPRVEEVSNPRRVSLSLDSIADSLERNVGCQTVLKAQDLFREMPPVSSLILRVSIHFWESIRSLSKVLFLTINLITLYLKSSSLPASGKLVLAMCFIFSTLPSFFSLWFLYYQQNVECSLLLVCNEKAHVVVHTKWCYFTLGTSDEQNASASVNCQSKDTSFPPRDEGCQVESIENHLVLKSSSLVSEGMKPEMLVLSSLVFSPDMQSVQHETYQQLQEILSMQAAEPAIICTSIETTDGQPVDSRINKWKKFGCERCGKYFANQYKLSTHRCVLVGEKPYKCQICNKSFGTTSNLARHRRVHTGEKPYKCPYCDKCFTQQTTLTDHKHVHTGEKPYKCEECGKAFAFKAYLFCHRQNHAKLKYECVDCGKRYAQKVGLTRHKHTHIGKTRPSPKTYDCEVCGRSFFWPTSLIYHSRSHTGERPYQCEECGKKFKQLRDVNLHRRTHMPVKPFQCNECGERFTQKPHLTSHLRKHSGEKPFVCSECGKAFTMVGNLNVHMRVHNKQKMKT
uniref:C2H2-type domain-containing protein n=1 Tax=Eptatretus burgeri TaxID=7764 RepID=A0A8C4N7T1_EPTBU